MAPAATPKPIVDKLSTAIQRILAHPEVGQKIIETGQEPSGLERPEEFRDFIRNDIDRWNQLIDRAGVKPEDNENPRERPVSCMSAMQSPLSSLSVRSSPMR